VFQELPAGGERDMGTVVTPHAVDSQCSHGLKCRTNFGHSTAAAARAG
jgi:hypothetical protein